MPIAEDSGKLPWHSGDDDDKWMNHSILYEILIRYYYIIINIDGGMISILQQIFVDSVCAAMWHELCDASMCGEIGENYANKIVRPRGGW